MLGVRLKEDDYSWMESMSGKRWTDFVNREQATWRALTQNLEPNSFVHQIRAAEEVALAPMFRAAGGRVHISVGGTTSIHWKWDDRSELYSATDLDAVRGGKVFVVRDAGDGAEAYVLEAIAKGSESKPLWRLSGVGPYVVCLGDRVFTVQAKNHLIYWRLISVRASDGKDLQIHYEEHDFRYNLELLRGNGSFAWLRRQAGPKQDVLVIYPGGKGTVLEGICIESRRFVLGSRAGEALVWTAVDGWKATAALAKRGWTVPDASKGTPEILDSDRGLLVTRHAGQRTLWRLGRLARHSCASDHPLLRSGRRAAHSTPRTLWSGLGRLTFDSWGGPWVRIWKAGCQAVWWQSELDARPHDPIAWCRETERLFVTSKDGSKVPYVLVRPLTENPLGLLVVGYGAYGIPSSLSTSRWEPMINAGWAVALGLWRGGGDDTPEWEDAGRLTGRVRVLEDAEAVVRAAREATGVPAARTVLYGRSAGGLWVGGLAAKHSDGSLAGGAYIEVGYLDAFRTMRNPHLPLTQLETDEFGLPAQRISNSVGALEWSPMDLLGPHGTPGMWQIVRTALNDKEVFPYESAKWVMASRAGRTARESRVFLAIEGGQGHFVYDGGFQAALDQATVMALAAASASARAQ
jgi:hypothetical protein